MSYIDGNLLAGEHVVFRTRLHWLHFIGPMLLVVFLLLPIAWLLFTRDFGGLGWITLGIALVILLAAIIKRQSSDFAITNKRVMMKAGMFRTRSIELLLSKVEAVAVDQSLMGRMFGYGDILVTGSGGTQEAFSHIQSPLDFRRAMQSVPPA